MAGNDFQLTFRIGARLASNFTGSFTAASNRLRELENRSRIARRNMEGFKAAAMGAAKVTAFMGAGAMYAANEAIKFESAMADVRKVVDFDTPQQFKQMGADILDMSTKIPMAKEELAAIVAAAGQSGVAREELLRFAGDAAKMGIAFDVTAQEAGQAMAEMRTAFKMNQDEVVALADKINLLGNKTPAAAKGIMEIVQRVGPLGEVAGFASGSIAALGATMRGMGIQEEIAATGIQNTMLALTAGTTATKSQREAYAKLGMDSAKIAKQMQVDAEGTTLSVLKAVSKLDKAEQASTLSQLFGKESIKSIAPLLTNMAALEKNFKMVGDSSQYAGSMQAEYDARIATTEANITLLKNNFTALATEIGQMLLPAINAIAGAIMTAVTWVRNFAKENPVLFKTILIVTGVIVTLVAALGTLAIGIYALAGPVTTAITIVKSFGTAFAWVSRIFMISPIGLILTAIALAIYLVYSNWSTIGPYLVDIWNSVKYGVQMAWDGIKAFFSSGIANISATIINWSPIGLFYKAFAAVMSWFGVSLPSKFTDFGRMIIQGLINGITSMAGAVMAKAKAIADKITSTVKGAFNIHSPSRVFAEMGKYNMLGLAQGMDRTASVPQRSALNAARETVPDLSGRLGGGNAGRSYGGGGINVTQHITVQGGGGDVYAQAKKGAASGAEDLKRQLKSLKNYESRVSYG